MVFLLSQDWSVKLMSDQTPVYAYELHHRGEHGFLDPFFNNGLDLPQAHKCMWVEFLVVKRDIFVILN